MFTHLLRRLFRPARPTTPSRRPRRPRLEVLEDRLAPAVNVFLSGRTLVAQGDNAGNQIQLEAFALRTLINGQSFLNTSYDAIKISSGSGNDTVQLNGTLKPVTINLGSGNDAVNIGAPSKVLDLRASVSVNHLGTGEQTLTYNDQANLTPKLQYTLSAGRIQRNGLADVTYTGPTTLSVNTSNASSTTTVLSTAVNAVTSVRGGLGNDLFFVGGGQLPNAGTLSIDGGGGARNLLAISDERTTVGAAYQISATQVRRSNAAPITYGNLSNLIITGGSRGNNVVVHDINPATETVLFAGNGNDTINVGISQGFATGKLIVDGGAGSDRLNINDQQSKSSPHTYALTSAGLTRDGTATVNYSQIENLGVQAGGAFDGSISVIPGPIGGNNTITVGDLGTINTSLNVGSNDSIRVSSFSQGNLSIRAFNQPASLVVEDRRASSPQSPFTYAVTANSLSRSGAGTIDYFGLSNLRLITSAEGSTINVNSTPAPTTIDAGLRATFRLVGPLGGPLAVSSTGGGKLDYSVFTQPVYVNLQTGEATGLASFSGIRDVIGGRGNDILVGDGQGNALNGGEGRNLLIAGNGTRPVGLVGGADEDILISGFTVYDRNRAALDAIMAVWGNNSRFYADRVQRLSTGTGAPALNATTVFGNQSVDSLVGNAGFDLFFATQGKDGGDADPEAETFVNLPLGGISGSVFFDRDGDGVRDEGEGGLRRVKIQLYRQTAEGDVLVGERLTDKDGNFSFGDWPAGTYRLVQVQPKGLADGEAFVGSLGGTTGVNSIGDIVVLPGQLGTGYTFAERRR